MSIRTRDFFKLQKPYETINELEEFFKLTDNPDKTEKTVENISYELGELNGSRIGYNLSITKIRGIRFRNVSFSKTYIHSINFQDCKFEKCLFINCWIHNCEFHNCEFIDTNPYKIEFSKVYIDPKSFNKCLKPQSDQNIGVHLYQRLMYNSSNENQWEFGRRASFSFNTWKRRQSFYEFGKYWSAYKLAETIIRLIWTLFGAGVYIRIFLIALTVMLLILSAINFTFRENFGLNEINDFFDALYFTVITMTTIGYGDITPTNSFGKVVVAFEGLIGFFLFALAASIAIRRIGP